MGLKIPFQYVSVAILIFLIDWFIKDYIHIDEKKIVLITSFLTGLYLLFHFLFLLLRRILSIPDSLIFLFLLGLKFAFILIFLLLYLHPMDPQNRTGVLLFFMNYFIFLITDIVLKVKLIDPG